MVHVFSESFGDVQSLFLVCISCAGYDSVDKQPLLCCVVIKVVCVVAVVGSEPILNTQSIQTHNSYRQEFDNRQWS